MAFKDLAKEIVIFPSSLEIIMNCIVFNNQVSDCASLNQLKVSGEIENTRQQCSVYTSFRVLEDLRICQNVRYKFEVTIIIRISMYLSEIRDDIRKRSNHLSDITVYLLLPIVVAGGFFSTNKFNLFIEHLVRE